MDDGVILKALSGFYYVETYGQDGRKEIVECRARGRFRLENITPLVGDRIRLTVMGDGKGVLEEILPRRNAFVRPPVANLDQLVIIASAVIPITDPFLIDRLATIAWNNNCDVVVCVNKCDLNEGNELFEIYDGAGYKTVRTSALTGEGIPELMDAISGKISAFTGNSGVGKSSILNALEPDFNIKVAEVSQKLGRGRHTTRHVELYSIGESALVADTPGFSSFDPERVDHIPKENLQYAFPEFEPYTDKCRFKDCSHIKEPGCAVLSALEGGAIHHVRHKSYVRLYLQASKVKEWEIQ